LGSHTSTWYECLFFFFFVQICRYSVQVSGFSRAEGRVSILWPHHCGGVLKDCGLGRYKRPGMVSRRRNGNLLVASGRHINCGWCVQVVRVVSGWTAVVLGAAVDCQQIPIAVRGGRLDVLHTAVESPVFKSILGLVSQRRRQLKSGNNARQLFP
jgi:hypothetical protein